jgi:hypothetical protein
MWDIIGQCQQLAAARRNRPPPQRFGDGSRLVVSVIIVFPRSTFLGLPSSATISRRFDVEFWLLHPSQERLCVDADGSGRQLVHSDETARLS